MNNFSVSIFLGKDRTIRFIPQVEIENGSFFPILEGTEIPFSYDAEKIGYAYCQTAQKALNHNKNDIKKSSLEYKAFRGFKSQRDFNSKHYCISSFAFKKITFKYLELHKGEFVNYTTDPQCTITIPRKSDYATIGQAILDVLALADKAYPKLDILSNIKSDDVNFALPTNSVTLLFKKANENFYDKIHFLVKEISVEEYSNDFCLISSEILSCLFEDDNLKDLNLLAKECEELICFCSYSTVGSYGFFHYRSGKCLRGYLSLDESGEVLHNIGNISNAEEKLGLKFPQNSDEFAEDGFDEINHDSLEKILSLIIN